MVDQWSPYIGAGPSIVGLLAKWILGRGGGTAMNGPAYISMIPRGNFHISLPIFHTAMNIIDISRSQNIGGVLLLPINLIHFISKITVLLSNRAVLRVTSVLLMFLPFRWKTRHKMSHVCVSGCVKFWSPPNTFQTSYLIDMKFWLLIQ